MRKNYLFSQRLSRPQIRPITTEDELIDAAIHENVLLLSSRVVKLCIIEKKKVTYQDESFDTIKNNQKQSKTRKTKQEKREKYIHTLLHPSHEFHIQNPEDSNNFFKNYFMTLYIFQWKIRNNCHICQRI